MFCFSLVESSFCFANVEFIAVPADSFIDDLGPLRSVQAIFVWKKGVDAACVLEYDLEIDERLEIVYAGFQTFRDFHCKIKETLFIQELKPSLNVNISSEKLLLF